LDHAQATFLIPSEPSLQHEGDPGTPVA
jgi:hypothetical protein